MTELLNNAQKSFRQQRKKKKIEIFSSGKFLLVVQAIWHQHKNSFDTIGAFVTFSKFYEAFEHFFMCYIFVSFFYSPRTHERQVGKGFRQCKKTRNVLCGNGNCR